MRERRRDFFRGLQRERYASRAYRNPHKQRGAEHTSIRLLPIGIGLISCAAIGGIVWILASGTFNIRHVEIDGQKIHTFDELAKETRAELNERAFFIIPKANRFIFDESNLRERLVSKFDLEDASVIHTGDQVHIVVKERVETLLWTSGSRLYLTDRFGVVLRELSASERAAREASLPTTEKSLPVFIDIRAVEVQPGNRVLEADEFARIMEFQQAVSDLGYPSGAIKVDRLAGAWMALTCDGFDVVFDPGGNAADQAKNLKVVLRERVPDPKLIEYIDVRFGDHVYYK